MNAPDVPEVVELVNRVVASRDVNAFGELKSLFDDRVYRYLYFRSGSHSKAEDLTLQVFRNAWEAFDRYRWQGRPFLAWLYRVAHNTHLEYVRSQNPTRQA